MLKRRFALVFVVVLLLSACQPAPVAASTNTPVPPTASAIPPTDTPVPTPTPVPPTATPVAPILELIGLDSASTPLTMDELMALPETSGQAGIKSSTGKITPPNPFTGVSLKDLVA